MKHDFSGSQLKIKCNRKRIVPNKTHEIPERESKKRYDLAEAVTYFFKK